MSLQASDELGLGARRAEIGDNFGDGAEALGREIEQFVEDCALLSSAEIDLASERRVAELVVRERRIRAAAEALKDSEKRPYLEECNRLDSGFRGAKEKLARALAGPKDKLRLYLIDQERERAASASAAREEAALAAREADALRAAAPDVAEALDAQAAEAARDAATLDAGKARVASFSGRGIGLKTVMRVVVEDWGLALAHVATHPDVRAAAIKALAAAARGSKYAIPLPGCRYAQSKEVA
jgi:hypothetical protein